MIEFEGHDIIKIRIGSWNGESWIGYPAPRRKTSPIFMFNEKEVSFEFELLDSFAFSIYTLTPSGNVQNLFWTTQRRIRWEADQCEDYAFCGANSICSYDGNHPTCECLRGYVPKSPDQWNMSIWSNGCVLRNKTNCKNSYTDGFLKYTHMKLPDTSSSWFNTTMNLEECQKLCLKNCSCTAYANSDIRDGGSGCLHWFHNLVDMRNFSQWGQDMYLRVPASELDHGGHGNIKKKIVGIIVGVTISGLIITCVCILIIKSSDKSVSVMGKT